MNQTTAMFLSALVVVSATSAARADDAQKAQCIEDHVRHQEFENDRRLRGAREAALACAKPSCPSVIQEECAEALARIEAALPSIVVKVVDSAGHDIVEARVFVDGEARGRAGTAIAVDPGPRKLRVESDADTTEQEVVVVEGERGRIVELTVAAAISVPRPAPVDHERDAPVPPPSEGPGPAIAFSGLAIGLAGLVTFGVAGGIAMARRADLVSACDGGICPPERDADLADGRLAGHVATVGLVIAGAGAALGVIGIVLATSDAEEEAPVAIVGPGFLGLGGNF